MSQKITFGKVLKETFFILKKSFFKTILFFIAVSAPFIIGAVIYPELFENPDESKYYIYIIMFLFFIILALISMTYIFRMLHNIAVKKNETFFKILYISLKKILPMMGLNIIFTVAIGICFLPLFVLVKTEIEWLMVIFMLGGYIVIIFLILGFSFSLYFMITEDKIGIIESLKLSWELTSKRKGDIFFINLLAGICSTVVTVILVFLSEGTTTLLNYTTGSSQLISTLTTIITLIIYLSIYPFYLSFYMAQFIELKRDKGMFDSRDITEGFMEDEQEEYNNVW